MSEIAGSKCQCVYTNSMITASRPDFDQSCPAWADSETGEAMLCLRCWTAKAHKEANMVPKRLPKREVVYGARA